MLRYYKPFDIFSHPVAPGLSPQIEYDFRGILQCGDYTNGFRSASLSEAIAARTGYTYAIPFGSGTQAIFLLARWFWKQGFRRIMAPAFTWPSTYKPFEWLGYRISFCDIGRETWLADFGIMKPEKKGLLGPELFIPVDTFGSSWDPTSEGWEVPFVDSAQSLGTKWKSAGPTRIISLSGSKILTTGEGGILLTQDKELAEFATNQSWFSRMPELSAALGLAYLEHFDEILEKKREIAFTYEKRFGKLGNGSVQFQKFRESNHYIVAGLVNSPREWIEANPEVEFRAYYDSIVNEKDERCSYEETFAANSLHLPNTEYVSRRILAFPSWPDMPLEAISTIVEP